MNIQQYVVEKCVIVCYVSLMCNNGEIIIINGGIIIFMMVEFFVEK